MGRRRRSLIGRSLPSAPTPMSGPSTVDPEAVVSDEDAPTVEGALTPELIEALRLDAEQARTTPPPAPAARAPDAPRIEQRRPVPSALSRPAVSTPTPHPRAPPPSVRPAHISPAPVRRVTPASDAAPPRRAPMEIVPLDVEPPPRPKRSAGVDQRYWIVAAGLVGAVGISVGLMMLLGWLLLEAQ